MKRSLFKMKKLGLLASLCVVAANSSYAQALSGTKTVGKSTSNYSSLTGAGGLFQDINTNGVNGTLTVLIDSSIIESGINGLNDFTSAGTVNNYVNIQPSSASAMVISTSATDTMIKLTGVRNLTIDGAYNGSGRYLTFRNTNATKNSAVISFLTSCSYDTLRNAFFEGSNTLTSPSNGALPGGTGTGSCGGVIVLNAYNMAGNKNIAITGNIIKNVTGTACNALLRSLSNGGTSPNFNDNDSLYIYKNHFVNANLTAIQLGTNSNRPGPWIIDNNYFYNTESYSTSSSRIIVNLYQGLGHIFTNNIIGGSDSTGGGTPMTFNGTAALTGVSAGGNSSTSLVQTRILINNNKIINININNSGSISAYYGILGSSKTEVGNNIVGASGTANAITTNAYSFIGVNITGTDNYVHDNSIRNITSTFAGTSATNRGVNGIGVSAYGSIVNNNTIDSIVGSTSANISTNSGAAAPSGIYIASQAAPGGTLISNNNITNIINTDNSTTSGGPGAIVTGINIANNAYYVKVSGNYISNIYGFNTNANYGNNISGILDGRSATTNTTMDTFVNNVIALGNNITSKSWVKGIDIISNGTNTSFYLANNSVNISSGLTLNSTLSGSGQNGASCFYRLGTAQNIYSYNNVFSNLASQTGTGNMNAMTINGVISQYYGNYNVFTSAGSNPVVTNNISGVATNYTLGAWKTASTNDTSSTNAAVPFVSNNDLHINTANAGAWNVFGRGLAIASIANDKDGNARSITLGVPTTAGAYEITAPTAVPNDVTMIPANPVAGTPTELWSNGRKIAEITWGAGATLPTALSAKFYPGVQAPALNYTPNTNAYFEITQTGFAGNYTIKQYVNAAEAAGQAFSSLRAAKRHNTDPYTFISSTNSNSMDANGAFLQSTTQTTFSTFGMTSGSTPLAIELKDINAINQGKDNKINWSTASELASDVFELQSSTDGKTFLAMTTIHANGTPGNYSYLDRNAANGITYYRIKTTGANGISNFSAIVSAKVDAGDRMQISVMPNPTSDVITIKSNLPSGNDLMIELRDITGRLIQSVKTANNNTTVDMTGLPAGTYIVRVSNGSSVYATKVIKN